MASARRASPYRRAEKYLSRTGEGAVWLTELAPLRDPQLVAVAIATTLGVQEVANLPLLETLVAYLSNKQLLLVLDNCEHVITQAATVVEALLQGCPALGVLATSREPLRVPGELAYRLPSLEVPSQEVAVGMCSDDALAYASMALVCRAR